MKELLLIGSNVFNEYLRKAIQNIDDVEIMKEENIHKYEQVNMPYFVLENL